MVVALPSIWPVLLFVVVLERLLIALSWGGVASLLLISRCSGDEWIGELLFLLAESPLPPRVEFRGETLPVCFG
jgi:hypothetical protein